MPGQLRRDAPSLPGERLVFRIDAEEPQIRAWPLLSPKSVGQNGKLVHSTFHEGKTKD